MIQPKVELITKPNEELIKKLVKLHLENLPESQLNKLGQNFLHSLYGYLANSPGSSVLVVTINNNVVGFLLGRKQKLTLEVTNPCVRKFGVEVVKNIIKLIPVLTGPSYEEPEIQFLAISKHYRGKGLGTKLVKEFMKQVKKLGYKKIIVGTHKDNKGSNAFYRKLGFKMLEEKEYFGQKFNYFVFSQ